MLPNCDKSAAHATSGKSNPLRIRPEMIAVNYSVTSTVDLNVQVPDFLPQRIAVEAQQVSRPDLIAAGRRERGREQRDLDLFQDAVIETRWRHAIREAGEVRGQIGLHRTTEIVDTLVHGAA